MNPKEKAKQLVEKFGDKASMVVDEILDDYSYIQNVRNADSNQVHSQRVYWQEVKQEIINLV